MIPKKPYARAVCRTIWTFLATASVVWPTYAEAKGGRTIPYSFQDEALLLQSQEQGGMVYISDAVPRQVPAPLVVFLHGINQGRDLHVWLGGGQRDLRPNIEAWCRQGVVQPVLLAAPSQTRDAARAVALWPSFDLDAFVEATDAALEGAPRVDRSKVVVVGHSGAGCNGEGGLTSVASMERSVQPLAIVAVDTCMDDDSATALALSKPPIHVYWQTRSWRRPFDRFRLRFARYRSELPRDAADILEPIRGDWPDPHNAIVPLALERALRRILPGDRAETP